MPNTGDIKNKYEPLKPPKCSQSKKSEITHNTAQEPRKTTCVIRGSSQTPKANTAPLLFKNEKENKHTSNVKILDGTMVNKVTNPPENNLANRNTCGHVKATKPYVKKPSIADDESIQFHLQESFDKHEIKNTMHKIYFDNVNKEQKRIQDFSAKFYKKNTKKQELNQKLSQNKEIFCWQGLDKAK